MTDFFGTTGVDTFVGAAGDNNFYMTNDNGPTRDNLTGGSGTNIFYYTMNDYSGGAPPHSPLANISGAGVNILDFQASPSNNGPAIDMRGCAFLNIQTIRIESGGVFAGEAVFNASQFGPGLIPWTAAVTATTASGGAIEIAANSGVTTIDASKFVVSGAIAFVLVGSDAGADTLIDNVTEAGSYLVGGNGNDTYVINGDETIQESAGQGNDTVVTRGSFVLGGGISIEVLKTIDPTATTAINLTGNELSQSLTGNAGDNVLDGGGGGDAMHGGAGDDTYHVGNAGDKVFEAAGQGFDTVLASVSFKLAVGQSIEILKTASASATTAINLTGDNFDQSIIGNAGRNTLDGGEGSDTLTGGAGADIFAFSTKLGPSNVDRITDYNVPADTISLSHRIFAGAGPLGRLSSAAFHVGASAADSSDRIIYNKSTGALYYDPDGLGGAAQIKFATLAHGLAITAADFKIV